MPSFESGDVTLYYEEIGGGFPILAFSPGGLTSTIDWWKHRAAAIDATAAFSDEYRVMVMDQRNAGGKSTAPITAEDGWNSYLADHVALLDHLGIEQCHLYGQCIGGPFVLNLLRAQPHRFPCAVLAQPIGRMGPLPEAKHASHVTWAEMMMQRPGVTQEVTDSVYMNLYESGFAYSVDKEFITRCQTPCMVLAGNDEVHPFDYAEALAGLLPNSLFIPKWRDNEEMLKSATDRIRAFLKEHTPPRRS
jgi:pimeloyl-ACP methyl ester carboxylesterase